MNYLTPEGLHVCTKAELMCYTIYMRVGVLFATRNIHLGLRLLIIMVIIYTCLTPSELREVILSNASMLYSNLNPGKINTTHSNPEA